LLERHTTPVISLAWHPQASKPWLLSLDDSNQLIVWNIETGERLAIVTIPDAVAVKWSPNQDMFVAIHDDGEISTWTFTP
jgi:WD40 repeat protein